MFVTFFCAILNIRTGQVDYSNGGHNLPYYLHHSGVTPLENPAGEPWGCGAESLHVRTDGSQPWRSSAALHRRVTEAMDSRQRLYSDQRLEQFLASNRDSSPRQIIADLVNDVRRFADGAPQSDDITALALLYVGATEKMRKELRSTSVTTFRARELNQSLTEFGRRHGLTPGLCTISISHLKKFLPNHFLWYTDNREHEIKVHLSLQPGEVKAEVEDTVNPSTRLRRRKLTQRNPGGKDNRRPRNPSRAQTHGWPGVPETGRKNRLLMKKNLR